MPAQSKKAHDAMQITETLTTSIEAYLDVIHELSHKNKAVRSVDVAQVLGVSRVSVNKALRVLKEAGFVQQQPYQSISLTEAGIRHAHRVTRRHSVLHAFFEEQLGMPFAAADENACRIEHVISDEAIDRLETYMQNKKP